MLTTACIFQFLITDVKEHGISCNQPKLPTTSLLSHYWRFLPLDAMPAQYMLLSCVRLSQAGTVPKRLYVASHKQHRTIAQGL